jgi:hypothetical protein
LGTAGTTILPWSGRPRDCLGGGIGRYGARYSKSRDWRYFKTINEPNDDVNYFRNNC